ncbi:MAG: 23S rRNA (uracil(1939)-C(5))-methyltransferase RlmD [Prevotella sp.]|uniref:23S rRNA (uracil(1939)-C(5))-methyltransferase RlmD n=1 Tax=Prevotella sp. TaxID=59823 RepID=UPI002A2FCBBF|nr:23S rRNA (uracil(1939)-C(5))-methyltransferase RlmD [Prevotella sp.]MDD7318258.1 23S rRNA (uracil(1939)-C(5))-methyltransferase RlmD [Prevotellaceae bacterium]MDY4019738.1 23S rRNA (uracil(1939)-C(5))-methyltransferase RlmD [Prevotella sp.]
MTRKKKPLPLLENITITDCAAEGKAIARVSDLVVFVPFCVPGDVVDIQLRKKKHNYAEGEVVRFLKKSDVRQEAMCQHFGVCGGCKWQILPYPEQLKMKRKQVTDQLRRIGKIELPEIKDILGSKQTREYRNKLEFGCSNKRWRTWEEMKETPITEPAEPEGAVGFHITGAFDKILPIENCHLMHHLNNEIRNSIRNFAHSSGMTFYDLRQQKGLLRSIMVRNSNTSEWMVLVQFHFEEQNDERHAMALMQHLADSFPQITSLLWVDNQKCNDTFNDLQLNLFKGKDHIFELMENLKFKVGPKSFYQTNTEQAYELYKVAREFAFMDAGDAPLVYDLYTGTGTIANFVSHRARKVIGIEYVPEAIEDAKVNSQINGINNTLFYAGDMKDILNEDFICEHGKPDIIITDPPRAGMHPDVVATIIKAKPRVIVYVSCNPATQARDLQLLDSDYRVTDVQPVDMFPHTPHVENVVRLTIREV